VSRSDGALPGRVGPGTYGDVTRGRPAVATALRSYQRAHDAFDEAVAERLGINRTDFRCLDILEQYQPMPAGALARAAGLSSGAATFAVDRLVASGFVRRRHDEADRRRILVEIVPEAHRTVAALHAGLVRDARRLLAAYSEEEIQVVCRFLEDGRQILERNLPT